MKYREDEGKWHTPTRRKFRAMCCDCGLVHVIDLRLVRNKYGKGMTIQWRWARDNRATAATKTRRAITK